MEYKITPATRNNDTITFELIHNGLDIAHINLSEIISGYEYFEDSLTEEEYDNIFIEDKYIYIEEVYVDKNWRGKGIANKIMNKFFEYSKRKYPKYDKFVLNASPMELSIPLNLLKLFYNKFDFFELIDNKHNCVMLRENN